MSPSLPANTLTKTSNNRGDIAAFARYFVTKELADSIPEESLDTTLDIVLTLRALKSCYSDYLSQLGRANLDLANIKNYLSPEAWQSLNTNKRLLLEQCIAREAEQINAGILRAIDFIAKQLIAITPSDAVMEELMARRVKQYPTYAPKPMRKAKRIKQSLSA
jgi:hypothetical protein